MNWDLVVWGLLLGLAGMLWMMVLAVDAEKEPRQGKQGSSSESGKEFSSDRKTRTPAA